MPVYEYQCESCGRRFEREQSITEPALRECPDCHGPLARLLSGGAGFILGGSGQTSGGCSTGTCSLEQTGRTCCGRTQRCEE